MAKVTRLRWGVLIMEPSVAAIFERRGMGVSVNWMLLPGPARRILGWFEEERWEETVSHREGYHNRSRTYVKGNYGSERKSPSNYAWIPTCWPLA